MRIATTALATALIVAVACYAIAPAREWTQDQAACRGGERVTVTTAIATDGRTAEDFAFICRKATGPVGVTSTSATLGGIGLSLLLGLVAGALLGGLLALRRRS